MFLILDWVNNLGGNFVGYQIPKVFVHFEGFIMCYAKNLNHPTCVAQSCDPSVDGTVGFCFESAIKESIENSAISKPLHWMPTQRSVPYRCLTACKAP